VADGLADPGNLGTLLRTALAAGAEAAFLTGQTVDPYNPKVVRGAMGAHFHLPIRGLAPGEVPVALEGLQIWIAEAGQGLSYSEVDWRPPSALVVGSEAEGPGEAIRNLDARHTHIPISPAAESLNAAVAAAVILFEIARQRGSP
jgi:TrmH family RNA methyltransferase